MTTKLSYSLTRGEDGYLARCEDLSVESTGGSPQEAVEALRKAIEQQLCSVEAMAPPSRPPPPPTVELIPKVPLEPEPQGPGDSLAGAPRARRDVHRAF